MSNDNYGWPKPEELGGSGLFFKFQEGENVFRIVDLVPRKVVKTWDDGKTTTKYAFRAVRVERTAAGSRFHHCIVELGNSLMKALLALREEEEFGQDVSQYTLKVTRSGDGMNTKYLLMAMPPKPLPEAALPALEEARKINLELAITGEKVEKDAFADDY